MYNLNEPMSFGKFWIMPIDLQVKYLEMLRDKFGASQVDIAKMMGCEYSTFIKHKDGALNGEPKFKSGKNSRLDKDAWNRFVNGEEAEDAVEADPNEEVLGDTCSTGNSTETEYLPYSQVIQKADIANGSMNLKGKADDIFRKMTDILGCENEYEIYVCFKSVNK